MITYIDNVKDRTTRRCSQEDFRRLTASEQTKQYIEQYRKTKQADWKHRLPAVLFQGYHPACLRGGNGTRIAKDLVPTGFFLVDFDHLSEVKLPKMKTKGLKPSQVYNLYLSTLEKLGLKLTDVCVICHTTPSGDGLRIVQIGRKGSNVIEDQQWLSAEMDLECDKAVKDLSRLSFIPRADEIFFINEELMFGEPIETYAEAHDGSGQVAIPTLACEVKDGNVAPQQAAQQDLFETEDGCDLPSGKFPADYHGIPYTEIVDRYINYHGGTPQVGERHKTLVDLAIDLRNITDNTVDWMMELIPNLGKTRSEKRDVIIWAVKQRPSKQSYRLNAVLKELKEKYSADLPEESELSEDSEYSENSENSEKAMPPLPKELPKFLQILTRNVMPFQVPAVCTMVFPALATHVSNCFFRGLDKKKFRLSMMAVLAGKQSVGKGCVDEPIEYITADIVAADKESRERERAWAASQQKKKANEKGSDRPKAVIRYLNSDITPAAMLQRLFAAENWGAKPNMPTFTKVEEIEELYTMCPTAGRSRITQLIRKCWDVGKIGSERFTSSAANFETLLAWNWTACGTIEKVRKFFASSLTDGTVSRVDFATIIEPEDDFEFEYGGYDDDYAEAIEPYIKRLQEFECQRDEKDRIVPFSLPQLDELEREMNAYIRQYSKTLEDTTWRDYAWRTKMISMKKILLLYIANGCKWEASFADFFRWSFHYSMWVKMNMFYEKATEDFAAETIIAGRQVASPLDYLPSQFSRRQFYEVMKRHGFKSEPRVLLCKLRQRDQIAETAPDTYTVIRK